MYDRYISLGMNCEAAFQFRRLFGRDFGNYFNWLYTPLPSLVAIIENDFKDIFLKQNLEPVADYSMVKDKLYGNSYHSPFKEHIGTEFSGKRFDELYAVERGKVLFFRDRFRSVASSPEKVLYYITVYESAPKQLILRLRDALRRRYHHHNFDILVIREEKNKEAPWNEPNIIERYVKFFAPVSQADQPDISAWDSIFSEFPFSPKRKELRTVIEKLKKSMPAGQINWGTHISEKYRYIYVETPKVCCGTIKSLLQACEEDGTNINANKIPVARIHDRNQSPLLSPSKLGYKFDELLADDNILKFCFVRHPYTRALSCYLDKLADPYFVRQINPFIGRDLEDDSRPTFEEFLSGVSKQSAYEMDPHWRIQKNQVFANDISYSFVGKFENFRDDISSIMTKLFKDSFKHEFLTHHGKGKTLEHQELLNDKNKEKIYEIYQEDFKFFNYQP